MFEKELDEITCDITDYDPEGKTQEQMDAIVAKYHKDIKASRMEVIRRALKGI